MALLHFNTTSCGVQVLWPALLVNYFQVFWPGAGSREEGRDAHPNAMAVATG
jgi:hypothetical protein